MIKLFSIVFYDVSSVEPNHRLKFHCALGQTSVLYGYFVSGKVGSKKPEQPFFAHAIQAINKDVPDIKPNEILFIDDSSENVEGGKQAGLESLSYTKLDDVTRRLESQL